jgi:threonine-phosphate decarboxylase
VWPRDDVVLAVPTFSEFHRAWPNARCVRFEDLPPDGFAVVTNPNNPTGAGRNLASWDRPGLVDESFIDFTTRPSLAPRTRYNRDLLVLRSLTKFYALPGLRVGALVGHPETMERLRQPREPWQVNVLAEAAVLAALAGRDWAERSRRLIDTERRWLWDEMRRLPDLRPLSTEANYYLVYTNRAADLCRWFLDRRVLLRDCTGWPGLEGEAFRFAIRTRADNCRLIALLREYLCAA